MARAWWPFRRRRSLHPCVGRPVNTGAEGENRSRCGHPAQDALQQRSLRLETEGDRTRFDRPDQRQRALTDPHADHQDREAITQIRWVHAEHHDLSVRRRFAQALSDRLESLCHSDGWQANWVRSREMPSLFLLYPSIQPCGGGTVYNRDLRACKLRQAPDRGWKPLPRAGFGVFQPRASQNEHCCASAAILEADPSLWR